jgi:hypothetical protein
MQFSPFTMLSRLTFNFKLVQVCRFIQLSTSSCCVVYAGLHHENDVERERERERERDLCSDIIFFYNEFTSKFLIGESFIEEC